MITSIPKKISMLKLKLIDTLSGTEIEETLRMLQVHQYLPAEELNAIRQKRLDDLFFYGKNFHCILFAIQFI